MTDILSGEFSLNMMKDWENNDHNLLKWREETGVTNFEKTAASEIEISNDDFLKRVF